MCLSVQSLTEQGWAQNFQIVVNLIYCSQREFMFCPERKVLFKPEKIYGTLSDILAVEMTKCTFGDWLAAFNITLHVKAAVAVASNNALKCYQQRLEHQSRKSLLGLSSSLWCCIVAFPLLVSYFDYCTSRCNALHTTQKQMNKYIMNISASSATYQHQTKCRA